MSDQHIQMARWAKALSHPVRLYIVELLQNQSCCFSGDLSEELDIPKSTLSQHLKELKDSGIIQGEIQAPKIRYCINQEVWQEVKRQFAPLFE